MDLRMVGLVSGECIGFEFHSRHDIETGAFKPDG
jgi:hypothetical protein